MPNLAACSGELGGKRMEITLKGVSIYYEQYGQGGQNVLLLHGWGCSTQLWKPVAQEYARHARVTVIDFPGHGKSGRPPEPWGTEEFADLVAELIEALQLSPCDVVGHSHGGRVALMLDLRNPRLVRRLVLTGSAGLRGKPTEKQKKRSQMYKRLRAAADGLEKMKIFGPLPEKIRSALRKKFGSADYNALDEEMRKTFVRLVNTDLTERLKEISASTLLLWGDMDTETPLWMGQTMEKEIPDAGLVILKGGTHFAYLEKLGDFLKITNQFLFGGLA